MLNSKSNKIPVEDVLKAARIKKMPKHTKNKGTASVDNTAYRQAILLFTKMLVTIFLCEVAIMALLNLLPQENKMSIILDPVLLTVMSTPILYLLLVRPIWYSLRQHTRAVEAFKEEKNKAQMYLDIAGVILVALDNEGRVTLINRKGCDVLGYDENEILGKNWFDNFVPDDERKKVRTFFDQLTAGKEKLMGYFENLNLTKDGHQRVIAWHNVVLRDENDNPVGTLSSGEDITERKKMQDTLHQSEQRYRSFVQNFQGIVYQGHLNFVPVFFHGSVEEITGYKECEFVEGNPRWDQIIHPDDLEKISSIAEELRTVPGFSDEREYRFIRKDGQIRWVHELIQNVCDNSGKPNMVQGAIYDITERKKMEEDLRKHREHLEELVAARTTELTKANKKLKEEISRCEDLEKELLTIIERERQRIGQELHDSIGQHLTGIAFMMEVLGEKFANKLSREEVLYAEKICSRVNQATELARNLAKGFHPIDLETKGLVFALKELTDNTEELFNISCSFMCNDAVSVNCISNPINVYRIAQEAITNAVKHGKARNIKINITSKDDSSILTVENDGLEFPAGKTHTEGMGLKIMRYRAELMNSSIDIRRRSNGGTIINCVIPKYRNF